MHRRDRLPANILESNRTEGVIYKTRPKLLFSEQSLMREIGNSDTYTFMKKILGEKYLLLIPIYLGQRPAKRETVISLN